MAAIGRRRSLTSTSSLATPGDRPRSKSPSVSSTTLSLASDAADGARISKSRRGSDDGRSDTSGSARRTRMARMFKGRNSSKRTSSASHSQHDGDSLHDAPPLPPSQSEESLGLAKSVASSLLTDDSDPDRYVLSCLALSQLVPRYI